jgi:purine-nucleoside phosphorylase
MNIYDKIQETAAWLRSRIDITPRVGVILGSGLGGLVDSLDKQGEIPYGDIPNFPVSTVIGHEGKLVYGLLGGKPAILMAGRFHFYEGYNMEQITFPVRVMKELGADTLIVSNAAGGMNPDYKVGDIVFIKDHINLFPEHPLRGHNDERLGTRFPDMSEPYNLELIDLAQQVALDQGLLTHHGVYIGLTGPTFETPAEYKWLHIIGGDLVGMSTVPEVIVAIHGGMKVFAASVVTDLGVVGQVNTISHEEVLEAANAAAPKLATLVTELVTRM